VSTTTVRVSLETRETLRRLAQEEGLALHEVLSRAVERYDREQFIKRTNEEYARLRADPVAWKELEDERALWDATLLDGLEDD
jgi:hypothetical protein